MLNTEEVTAIVGYICTRCFLGRVPASQRNGCHHCAKWSNEEADAVKASVKDRLTDLRDALMATTIKEAWGKSQ